MEEERPDYDDGTSAQLRHPWLLWAQIGIVIAMVLAIVFLAPSSDVTLGAPVVLILFGLLTASSIYGVTLKRR